jgi:hypothetical protein
MEGLPVEVVARDGKYKNFFVEISTVFKLQDVRKVWNQWELYLLFTLYVLYLHPDTLRILSAALPCLCGFCSTYWDRQ